MRGTIFHAGDKLLIKVPRMRYGQDFKSIIEEARNLVTQGASVVLALDERQEMVIEDFKFDIDKPFNIRKFSDVEDGVDMLLSEFASEISQVIVLTRKGGIVNKHNERVMSFLTFDNITDILKGEKPKVHLDERDDRHLKRATKMLASVDKLAIVNADNFKPEMDYVLGGGTLCVKEIRDLEMEKLKKDEYWIFEEVYNNHTKKGFWREKNLEQKKETMDNHFLFKGTDLVLGGFTALARSNNWYEITNFWAQYRGNGLGNILMQEVKNLYPKHFLFCKKDNLISQEFFAKNGLVEVDKSVLNFDTLCSEGAKCMIFESNRNWL
ncbi:MAG: GNAT family N-acetyltransferase [Candidatus Gracilibacteria bacterium]|jgi:hypothetical protein|nr:GNAT family N-acetyltransferase [Candidatus Gracilibacteria bacterium]